jgi:hypothetical protein
MTDERLSEVAGSTLREQVGSAEDRAAVAAQVRFVEAALASRKRPSHSRGLVAAIGAVTALVGIVAVLMIHEARRPLFFSVGDERRPGNLTDYIVSPRSEEVPVYFSDGTALTLESVARARVQQVTAHGATVVIEGGAVDANVAHREGSDWTFTAGPYSVHVTGTSFVLSWSPSAGLDLQMRAGAVRIVGPGVERGVVVQGREHFASRDVDPSARVSSAKELAASSSAPASSATQAGVPPESEKVVERATNPDAKAPRAPRGAASELATAAVPQPTPSEAPLPTSVSDPPPAGRDTAVEPIAPQEPWSTMVARGEYAKVLDAAAAVGNDAVLQTRPESDVEALADAARFSGRNQLAEQAFGALRRRFAGTAPAIRASFLLGRMVDDAGNARTAVSWYSAYLGEAPSGSFAAEALGRRMLALRRLNDPESTRLAARDYLARFPTGPYAHVAQEIVAP